MIAYFKQLFDYDRHSNLAILDTILSSGVTEGKPTELMAHLLAAQQTWLKRCKTLPAPGGPLWPDWKAEELKPIIEQNHQDWIDFLNSLPEGGLEQSITYKNTRGEGFTNTLKDIVAHLINHGTHHRAQIGQLLKLSGVENLPVTDYIFYVRQL